MLELKCIYVNTVLQDINSTFSQCYWLWAMRPAYLVCWHAPPVWASWGLNIEFEQNFGGKLRWLIHCRLGSECCLPNNQVTGSAPTYGINSWQPSLQSERR